MSNQKPHQELFARVRSALGASGQQEQRGLAALEGIEEQYEDVQRRLEASVPATHRLQVENRRLLEQLEAAHEQLEAARHELERHTQYSAWHASEVERLQEQLEAAQRERDDLEQRLADFKAGRL